MRRHPDVSLAIIAGGQGSRLSGVPKGLLVHQGRTLLSRLLDLRTLVGEVFLVANDPRAYATYGVSTVPDVVPDRGAPGGVHAALVYARTEWVLALGCDMPFIAPEVVELVLSARAAEVDIVAFEIAGRIEPLLAAYRQDIAGPWGTALASAPSFGRLFRAFRTKLLSERALRAVDADMRAVVSINTPDDAARFAIQLPDLSGAAP